MIIISFMRGFFSQVGIKAVLSHPSQRVTEVNKNQSLTDTQTNLRVFRSQYPLMSGEKELSLPTKIL
jgi:hypothetical protein